MQLWLLVLFHARVLSRTHLIVLQSAADHQARLLNNFMEGYTRTRSRKLFV